MTKERYLQIKAFRDDFDSLPDGAFFAMSEEHGIDVEEWAEFSEFKTVNK